MRYNQVRARCSNMPTRHIAERSPVTADVFHFVTQPRARDPKNQSGALVLGGRGWLARARNYSCVCVCVYSRSDHTSAVHTHAPAPRRATRTPLRF